MLQLFFLVPKKVFPNVSKCFQMFPGYFSILQISQFSHFFLSKKLKTEKSKTEHNALEGKKQTFLQKLFSTFRIWTNIFVQFQKSKYTFCFFFCFFPPFIL